jgi:hypothetical protein
MCMDRLAAGSSTQRSNPLWNIATPTAASRRALLVSTPRFPSAPASATATSANLIRPRSCSSGLPRTPARRCAASGATRSANSAPTPARAATSAGVSEQQVQRDESGAYEHAQFARIADVLDALRFELKGQVQSIDARAHYSVGEEGLVTLGNVIPADLWGATTSLVGAAGRLNARTHNQIGALTFRLSSFGPFESELPPPLPAGTGTAQGERQ